jgi:hypothetical protein
MVKSGDPFPRIVCTTQPRVNQARVSEIFHKTTSKGGLRQ